MSTEELKQMKDEEVIYIVDRFLKSLGYPYCELKEDKISYLEDVKKRFQLDTEYVIFCLVTDTKNTKEIKLLNNRIDSNELLVEEINQFIKRLLNYEQIKKEEKKKQLWPFKI